MKDNFQFSILNPTLQVNIPQLEEKTVRGKEYVSYGTDNKYPEYLLDLYNSTPTLQAIINASVDYITGKEIRLQVRIGDLPEGVINKNGDSIESLIKHLAMDKMIFGGFAYQVIRSLDGEIAELYYLDFSKIRKEKDVASSKGALYYADSWGYATKAFKYEPYNSEAANSIVYEKGYYTRTTYPAPIYNAAITACEIEKQINTYHLNNLVNGFSSSAIISLNNGVPDDEQKDEIERGIFEKYSGAENAGRMMIVYNDSKENAVTVEKLDVDDWSEKYQALSRRTIEQIFLSFGCSPIVLGLEPEHTGWAKTEYKEAYALYMSTRIAGLRTELCNSLAKVLGEGCVTFIDEEPINTTENE